MYIKKMTFHFPVKFLQLYHILTHEGLRTWDIPVSPKGRENIS